MAGRGTDGRERSIGAFDVGAEIGPYVIESTIARGGQGVVLRARDPRLNRSVALKVVDDSDGESLEEQLVGEARSLAKLSHPNILPVFDVGLTSDGRVWVAMELVDGATIDVWARRATRAKVLRAWLDVGRAVAHAHAAGVLHRDIKPGNVMVDGHDRVRVVDFGLVRDASSARLEVGAVARQFSVSRSGTGEVIGTLDYMAPELFRGGAVTTASDQFSYCVALYRALFAKDPFDDASRARWVKELPETPRAMASTSGVDRALESALLRGLSLDPAARWPTMDALVTELDRVTPDATMDPFEPAKARVQMGVVMIVLAAVLVSVARINAELTAKGLARASVVVVTVIGLATWVWRRELFRTPYTRLLTTLANLVAWIALVHRVVNLIGPVDPAVTLRGDALMIAGGCAYVGIVHDRLFFLATASSVLASISCALWPAHAASSFGASQVLAVSLFAFRAARARPDEAS
ncbi:MAG: serine/threonine protein kinase [Myxococcales bacterium]|nr:serine/threonine protein kinase [Myxococcales bacterium]